MVATTIHIPSDVHSILAHEARNRGLRVDELAGLKLTAAVLTQLDSDRANRQFAEIERELTRLGIELSGLAVERARENGLTLNDMRERISAWKALPSNERDPGKLFNWLTVKRSFTRFDKQRGKP